MVWRLVSQFKFSENVLNGNHLLPEIYFLPFFNSPPNETFPNPYLGKATLSHRLGFKSLFPQMPCDLFVIIFKFLFISVCMGTHVEFRGAVCRSGSWLPPFGELRGLERKLLG